MKPNLFSGQAIKSVFDSNQYERRPGTGGLVSLARCVSFSVGLLLLGLGAARASESEQFKNVGTRLTFPQPANEVKGNLPPTIGRPQIVVPPDLISNLGGGDITNLVVSSIGDLLVDSDRFILTYSSNSMYHCRVALTDFQMHQYKKNSATDGSGFFGTLLTNVLKVNVNGKPTRVDMNRDELRMSVRCSVSVDIVDADQNVLAGNQGDVVREDTTKNINMELAGLTQTNSTLATNTISFESRLILLASYYALMNMLPQLDNRLAMKAVPVAARTPKGSSTTPENSTGGGSPSLEERLERIKAMESQGLISQEDYEKMKQKILSDATF